MKLRVITFIVTFQCFALWSQEQKVIIAEKVADATEAGPKASGEVDDGAKSTKAESGKKAEKSEEIDDFSLPSLNLFPLLDPNMTSKLPPLPRGSSSRPAKKYVNGRYVITRVPRSAPSKKPEMELRKVKGKWVIGLKN